MNQIEKRVAAARRRLWLGRWGRSLCIASAAALVIAAIGIAAAAFVDVPMPHARWVTLCVVVPIVAAVVFATTHASVTTPSAEATAAEVDRRFELSDRLASAKSLSTRDRQSDFGAALIDDASKRAETISIGERFALRPARLSVIPLALAALVAVMVALIQPATTTDASSTTPKDPIEIKQVKTVAKQLKRKIASQRRKAEAKGLEEAREMFEKMEAELDKLTARKDLTRKQAMIELNDLKKQLEERRKQLGSSEQMRKMMSQMSGIAGGPAEKIAKAMQKGDFSKAEDMVREMSEKLKKGKLSEQEKKELAKQIEKMADQMKKAAEQNEKKQEELKRKIEQAKKEGRGKDADKMQQELNQMQKQQQQMDQMKNMAESMKNAAQAMQNGDAQSAADAMDKMAEQLGDMQSEMDQLQDLEETFGDLSQMKQQMRCKQCNGQGCQGCQGGMGEGEKPGQGLGKGAGEGDRPENETDTNTYQTQVRGEVRRGRAVISGFADGPNRKGETRDAITQQLQDTLAEESDPTESQVLPRTEREHAQQYFDRLRKN